MPVVNITDTTQWINISALSGLTGSLVITNCSSHPLYSLVSPAQPEASALGVLCKEFEEVLMNNQPSSVVWVKAAYSGPVFVQAMNAASSEYSIVDLPSAMYTSGPEGFRRLRVDNSETSFFLGQSFRTFYEYSLGAGASVTIRFTRATNVIIQTVDTTVEGGTVKLEIFREATPSGTWNVALPIVSKNEMTTVPQPAYVSQAAMASGGTITAGTLRDVVRIAAPTASGQSISTGASSDHNRGVSAATVGYYRLTNIGNGTITGVFKIEWEERP